MLVRKIFALKFKFQTKYFSKTFLKLNSGLEIQSILNEKIKGFENYSISQNGIVINTQTGRKLKGEKSRGYFRVSLCKESVVKRFLIHRLVAYHFLINEENKKCVNHKDGNKLNNKVSNLEWCTHSENEQHSYDFLNKIYQTTQLFRYCNIEMCNYLIQLFYFYL